MKAFFLKQYGEVDKAFELRETETPIPLTGQVLVKVEAFGLNFADVMARQGLYRDAPPLPAVLGYEVVGRITEIAPNTETDLKIGQRVVALTRFGGYAEYAVTDVRAAVAIPDEMDNAVAAAIATQYGTAYYCAYEMAPLFPGNHVLIQAAAGGVGTALVQMAKNRGCVVYGTAGSQKKLDYLKDLGVDHPINYNTTDFSEYIRKHRGDAGLDVIFDSLGGEAVKKGLKLLGAGGRIVCYGAASRSGKAKGFFSDIRLAWGFGIYSPIPFLMNSKGIIGVNMLKLADNRPESLQRCLENVAQMIISGDLKPYVGGKFRYTDLAKAHDFLGNRGSIGKIAVEW